MQAVRQCTVCATRHTDVLLLRTNMAALRRGVACLRLLRTPAVQRFGRWTHVVRTSVGVGGGLCAVPFTQRRYLASLGKLTPAEEDSIWQVIIGQRMNVSERLEVCKRFESTWTNALNLCEMAAEAATHIHLAQTQVSDVQKLSKDAEKKLAESKVEEIQRMAEYSGSREEHELHEAYLRED
ncbi:hypothetical protein CRUP_026956 [Coryphaenoides rupestris]|nr:hypothetical protein CRUP_026956 [Coryphaenoides rupestris]